MSAGIGAASLLYGVGKSISQNHKANQIDKNNPRPSYQIPDEYRQNLAIAKQMATIGIPQAAYNNQQNAISRNQAGAIGALGNSANPGAGLASIVRAGNDAQGNLNAQDALARQQGKRGVMQANLALAGQKLGAQQYNQFDKYSENFNRSQALRGAANTDLNNSVNGAAQLAGGLYGMGQYGTTPNGNGQGVQNWGFGTMGAKYNSPVLNASGGTNGGIGYGGFNPYGQTNYGLTTTI